MVQVFAARGGVTLARALLVCLVLVGCGGGGSRIATDLQRRLDAAAPYPYVDDGVPAHTLTFYPELDTFGPRPVLVWIHGGSWVGGNRLLLDPVVFELAVPFHAHVATVGYRTARDSTAPWPSTIQDIKAAIRFLKLHAAEFRIDPTRIVILGESAGAHLAALTALTSDVPEFEGADNPGPSSEVAAAILFSGVYDFLDLERQTRLSSRAGGCAPLNRGVVRALLDCPTPSTVSTQSTAGSPIRISPGQATLSQACGFEKLLMASPLSHVDASDPPIFLAHGAMDCVAPKKQSEEMAAALASVGVPVDLHISPDGEHPIESLSFPVNRALRFLFNHVDRWEDDVDWWTEPAPWASPN